MEILVLWVVCCVVGIAADNSKGYSGAGGFWLCLFFGPLGVLIVLLWPAKRQDKTRETEDGDQKTCPHCRSLIPEAASVCRYCQRDVFPEKKTESLVTIISKEYVEQKESNVENKLAKAVDEREPCFIEGSLHSSHSTPILVSEQKNDVERDNISEARKTPSLTPAVQSFSFFQDRMFWVCGAILILGIILGIVANFSSKTNSGLHSNHQEK